MESSNEYPLIKLPTDNGELDLHWGNTCIRLFKDVQYDHIEYYEETGTKGLRVARYILDTFIENDYPSFYTPVVDDSTYEWFIKAEMKSMEYEIEDL